MKRALLTATLYSFSASIAAHQPIIDMAPRWNDGYGVQVRTEHANSDTTTWLEGVYTFQKAVRATLKIPTIDGDVGDAIFALPLKNYTNDAALTYNWGVTPAIRAPTGGGDDWDAGLSVSYSSESVEFYQLYELYTLGDTTGFDANFGKVFPDGRGSSWFTLWDISAVDSNAGQRILTGPVLVYFKRNVAARLEYKFSAYDDDVDWEGNYLSFTLGFVY